MEASSEIQKCCSQDGCIPYLHRVFGCDREVVWKCRLGDLLIESGVIAPGSVQAVLGGHHYNRGVRAHKIVWEALSHLRWKGFESFVDANGSCCPVNFNILSQMLGQLRRQCSKEGLENLMKFDGMGTLLAIYDVFCVQRSQETPLFSF